MNDAIALKNIYSAPGYYIRNKNISEEGMKEFLNFPISLQYYIMGRMANLLFEYRLSTSFYFVGELLRNGAQHTLEGRIRASIIVEFEFYKQHDQIARKWIQKYSGIAC